MNGDTGSAPEESIIRKILEDGKAQADRTVDSARRSQESERRKAEAEALRIRKDILAQAEARARTLRAKDLASGHMEAKRVLLRAREEAVSKVFDVIREELKVLQRDHGQYRQSLLNLAVEAIVAVAEAHVVLRVGEEDNDIVDDAFLEEMRQRLGESAGQVSISVEPDPRIKDGGCIAVSGDGRVVFDNTFRRRLERMRPALRSVIVKEVLKTDV